MNTSDLEGVKTKVCSKCKIEKPVVMFSKADRERDRLDYWCKECKKEYRKTNSEKIKGFWKDYYKANSCKIKEYQKEYSKYRKARPEYHKEYYKANSEKLKECSREYNKANSCKIKDYHKGYCKNNLDKRNAYTAKRRSKKLQATPPWLTKEHLSAIRDFYTESKTLEKATGIKHHVDHIVPLQGKNVCGLHVPWNLQVLTASENSSKNNSYPDEWEDT